MRCILAIDQGSSATKVIVFRQDGTIAASAVREVSCLFPRPGIVEQDPQALYGSVIEAVRKCLSAFETDGGSLSEIASCGISNQRETFLLWDAAGTPLCRAVSWQCERSADICAEIRCGPLAQEVMERTGLLPVPYFSGTKLLWLLRNEPTVREAVSGGRARFGTIDTWLLWRLTNGEAYATDYTNASRTLLFDIDRLSWDAELRSAWDASDLLLPACHPSVHSFGETDFEGALPRKIPIDALIGDSHAAAFGEGCVAPGMVKATLGTGCSLLMDTGEERRAARVGIVSTINWSTRESVHYALEGIIVSCGATLSWMRDQFGFLDDGADAERIATSVPDNGGVYVIPAFSGLGSPRWRSAIRGSIVGLSFASTRAHAVRAALESIPYQIAEVLSTIARSGGVRPVELRVDGGLTVNRLVLQILADTVGIPVISYGLREASALGAAMLAGLGARLYASLDALPRLSELPRRYEPGPGAAAAKRRFEEWLRYVDHSAAAPGLENPGERSRP